MPFDFAAVTAPFRMQPGLRRVAAHEASPLTPTHPCSPHLAAKLTVLSKVPEQALLSVAGVDRRVPLSCLLARAVSDHPRSFDWDGADRIAARQLGWALDGVTPHGDGPPAIGDCLRALAPEWRAAGLLSLAFEEDFALIDGLTTRIPWLAVCLPSHWSPQEKLGRSFAEVHAPVADNAVLLAAGAHLARLVSGTDRWERFVWTVTPRPALDAHPARVQAAAWPPAANTAELAAMAFFRTEHQTFLPLPRPTAGALFTIRVEVRPLVQAIDSRERARQLHDALASMSDAVLAYRGLAEARERLLEWLGDRLA